MRSGGASWRGSVVFTAGYIGATWAASPERDNEISNYGPGFREQKIVAPAITGSTTVGSAQEPLSWEAPVEGAPSSIEKIIITTTTKEVDVTVTYPKITEGPGGSLGQKRDATSCPSDYQLCPKSLSGGCCPNDRVCGANSCLPTSTTAGPASACGMLGYVACDISDGGGCCPEGYLCGQAGCTASAGVSYSETCGANSYLCPASLGYGCCKNGLSCALSACWETSATVVTLIETPTTTDASSNTLTITTSIQTSIIPSAPTATATAESGLIPKVTSQSTAIPKVAATGGPGDDGLSKAAIGGIIAGAVIFLIVILVVAFLILRKLKAIETASKARSRTHSSSKHSGPRSGLSGPRETPDVSAMSFDPLMITGSTRGDSVRFGSFQLSQGSPHEVEASPQSPPGTHYPRGYHAVASSDTAHVAHRNGSVDSTPPILQNHGYFDESRRTGRNSRGPSARRPSAHGRNWSNASGESDVSAISDSPVELYAGTPKRRASIQETLSRFGLGSLINRQRSRSQAESPPLEGGPRSPHPDWPSPMSPPLGGIEEAKESHEHISKNRMQLTGAQLREAGLSNSQLREMTLTGKNPFLEYTQELK